MINLNSINDSDADVLIQNVESKYKPIFDRGNYSSEEKRTIALKSADPLHMLPQLEFNNGDMI